MPIIVSCQPAKDPERHQVLPRSNVLKLNLKGINQYHRFFDSGCCLSHVACRRVQCKGYVAIPRSNMLLCVFFFEADNRFRRTAPASGPVQSLFKRLHCPQSQTRLNLDSGRFSYRLAVHGYLSGRNGRLICAAEPVGQVGEPRKKTDTSTARVSSRQPGGFFRSSST